MRVDAQSVIIALCKQDKLAEAFASFQQMPSSFAAAALIVAFARKRKDLSKVMEVYRTLTTANLQPTAAVLDSLLRASRACGQPGKLLNFVLAEVEKFNIRLTSSSVRYLADACADALDARTCRMLVKRLATTTQLHGEDKDAKPTVIDCTQFCKALLPRGDLDGAFEVLDCMNDNWQLRPDASLCALVLSGCAKAGSLLHGQKLLAIAKQQGLGEDAFGAALVSLYCKCGLLEKAEEAFNRWKEQNKNTDVRVWTSMMAGYVGAGLEEKALALFNEMNKTSRESPKPNQHTYTVALRACGNVLYLETGRRIHAQITESGIPISDFLMTALMSMYSRCGQFEEAIALFYRVDRSRATDIAVWSTGLGVLVKKGESKKASALFEEMIDRGITPDAIACATVLPACGDFGGLEKGRKIHALIKARRMVITDALGAALVHMYGRCGALAEAISFFSEMKHSENCGLSTWTAVISVYADHKLPREALRVLEEMTASGIRPNAVTLCAVMNACSQRGLVKEVIDLVASMETLYGVPPDARHHSCVVDTLGRAGRLEEAEAYLLANQAGCNDVVWGAMLGACRIHKDVERGIRAERQLRKLAPRAAGPRVLMSNIYGSAGMWEEKDRVRQQMKEEGIHKTPGITNIEVRGEIHEFTAADKKHPQINAIRNYLAGLWRKMKLAGYAPRTDVVMHDMTEEEKDDHLCHHSEKLALAFGLLNTPEGTPLIITKNLRVCPDCHEATKFISWLTGREISVRDANGWHRFDPRTKSCSCQDYW